MGAYSGILETSVFGAKWYCSAICFAQTFCRLASVGGGFTQRNGQICYLGFPVVLNAKLPNSTSSLAGLPMLYFGNLKQSSVLAEQQGRPMQIAISAQRYLETDQILVRAVRREHIINHYLGDSATYGAMAMLSGTT